MLRRKTRPTSRLRWWGWAVQILAYQEAALIRRVWSERYHTQGEEHGQKCAQSLGTVDCSHHLPGDDCELAVWLDVVCPADEPGPWLGHCRDPDCVQHFHCAGDVADAACGLAIGQDRSEAGGRGWRRDGGGGLDHQR